jgi:hypothetical protein
MRRLSILALAFITVSGINQPTLAAKKNTDSAKASKRVCINAPSGKVTINVGNRVIPININDFANPGGPDKALCCSNCSPGNECTGCTNLPPLSTCHGHILACPSGEVLDEDGGGSCADQDAVD